MGVRFADGANNTLTSHGAVTTANGIAGMAISGTVGNETIHNFGAVTGNVNLGAGANAFNNKPPATFNAGATVNLGAGNSLTNDGAMLPGGSGNVLTTALTGNMFQSASGAYGTDLHVQETTDQADRINVSGTANLAGSVNVNIVNAGFALPGAGQATILSAAGGTTNSGLSLIAPTSAVATYQLLFPNPNDVALGYNIDFSPAGGLNINQTKVGNYINRIQLAGGSASFAPIAEALFFMPDVFLIQHSTEFSPVYTQ